MGRWWYQGLFFAGVGLPVIAWAIIAWHSYNHELENAREQAERRVTLVADYVARTMEAVSMAMALVDHETAVMRDDEVAASGSVSRVLTSRVQEAETVGQILIVDHTGVVAAASRGFATKGMDVSDREYIRGALKTNGQYVGPEVVGRTSGQTFFTLSQRRANGGAVVAALYTRAFERMFRVAAESSGTSVSVGLFRADGRQLARYPHLLQPIELKSSSGLMQGILRADSGSFRVVGTQADGKDRIFAYRRVGEFPVYATYGISVEVVVENWRREMAEHGTVALALSLILGVAANTFVRRERARQEAEDRLQGLVAERTAEAEAAMRAREVAVRQAEIAHLGKSHFLAAASHDLRQPIQGLRLFVDVLAGRLAGTEHEQAAELAARALEGAEQLLDALLDVSTLDAGMVRVERQAFQVEEALQPLAEEAGAMAADKGLGFRHVPCGLWVDGDPVLLQRMVRNLLVNAIRYTDSGRILLGCRRRGHALRIEVWDSGAGIPEDALELVFEDFVQLGNPQRDRRNGLGLGLSVVRRMASLLGHDLDVRSTRGRGSMFAVVVPVVNRPATPQGCHVTMMLLPSGVRAHPIRR